MRSATRVPRMRIAQLTDLHVGYRIPLGGGEVDTVEQVRRAVAHAERSI